MNGSPSITSCKRQDLNLMTYEEQILKSLRQVIREEDLVRVKDNIIDGLKKHHNNYNKIMIEAQLPRKSNNSDKNDFRGSKYRGPSKNRKKWQVMKMINKQTVRIGAVRSELDAAHIYDFLAILTEGLTVSLIFNYLLFT